MIPDGNCVSEMKRTVYALSISKYKQEELLYASLVSAGFTVHALLRMRAYESGVYSVGANFSIPCMFDEGDVRNLLTQIAHRSFAWLDSFYVRAPNTAFSSEMLNGKVLFKCVRPFNELCLINYRFSRAVPLKLPDNTLAKLRLCSATAQRVRLDDLHDLAVIDYGA